MQKKQDLNLTLKINKNARIKMPKMWRSKSVLY